ncbi:type VI secretion system baseplate subunit TssF [Tamlana sp. I1]|uniref:type VI secretion system baseplate subunit TssF n=1 Tax=Tamlana sp. I1 TaxID=2762061 RepID=UPI00188E36C7|nr:type VI secretion system baseplate subunit TssF [Tamlana sp. I1]
MVNSNYEEIKARMKMRAMELWGIDKNQILDPLIEMFLDVFSFELSKVYQDVKISDAKLLERISKILVNENWSLPIPAHALISLQPSEDTGEISKKTQLYFQKISKGDFTDIFFTPLDNQELIKAKIYCTAFGNQLTFNDKSSSKPAITSYKETSVSEYSMWVGIDIDEPLLDSLNNLSISLLLKDSNLNSYLKMAKVYDFDENEIHIFQKEKKQSLKKEHYYDAIHRYYQDYLYTLDLSNSNKKKHTLVERCKETFNSDDLEANNKNLFWLKIVFPVAFVKEELEKISISLNTFPIVNRKFSYRQHNIKRNGKIISLFSLDDEFFLNTESLIDDNGIAYKSALKNDINNLAGSFSLYFGDIEQFDERNAKFILNQVIQTVREEGSSFSAIGYDLLNAYLEDLNDKLNVLEKKVNYKYKNVSDNNEKVYLLTMPHETSNTYECAYWTTNANLANGIKKGTLLCQYQTIGLESDSILLQTDTVGGMVKNGTKEKISSFRYGLLSKNRIVSNEDIKEFVSMTVGNTIKSVAVKSGVGISSHKKQGLVRTINVDVGLLESGHLNHENKKRLSHFLQLELQNKSVHNTPYRVNII